MDAPVLFEKKGKTAYVILNRPEHNNAINLSTRKALCDAWEEIERDQDILSVILTGGERIFSTGQDLVELSAFREKEPFAELPLNNLETFGANVQKPVIAAVSGHCLGAGFLLTLVCSDIRIASETTFFGMPEVKVGVPPAFGIPAILSRHFPPAIAAELLLFGKTIDAHAAYRMGYVNEVVPVKDMLLKAEQYALQVNELSSLIIRNIKDVLRRVTAPDPTVIAYSNAMCMLGRHSEDYVEGPRAFKEKRKPVWKGH
jgi:enoyl-CoA hydratase/carnithine racemase